MKQLIYSRHDAARKLEISEGSLDIMIRTGALRSVHKGSRVYITREEIERVAAQPLKHIWPAKRDGKTTRHFAPPATEKKPPAPAIAPRRYEPLDEELPADQETA